MVAIVVLGGGWLGAGRRQQNRGPMLVLYITAWVYHSLAAELFGCRDMLARLRLRIKENCAQGLGQKGRVLRHITTVHAWDFASSVDCMHT